MLHEIGVELATALGARGCGIPVIDGPERRTTTTYARERVVIEHDTAADSFESRHRTDTNARTRLTRVMACKLTIYAQEPNKGAAEWEHRRRVENILDCALISLDVIAKKRQNLWVPKSGKFIYPEDLKSGETHGGAVYELAFTFDRGVAAKNFALTGAVAVRDDGSILTTNTITQDSSGVTVVTSKTIEEPGATSENF